MGGLHRFRLRGASAAHRGHGQRSCRHVRGRRTDHQAGRQLPHALEGVPGGGSARHGEAREEPRRRLQARGARPRHGPNTASTRRCSIPPSAGRCSARSSKTPSCLPRLCRAYNDWSLEYCGHAPQRLRMAAMLPVQAPALAIEEAPGASRPRAPPASTCVESSLWPQLAPRRQ